MLQQIQSRFAIVPLLRHNLQKSGNTQILQTASNDLAHVHNNN